MQSINSKLIADVASETLSGVQLEYRSELLRETTAWALNNSERFEGTSELKFDKFTDEVIDKMQDIASANHYPLVEDLFA